MSHLTKSLQIYLFFLSASTFYSCKQSTRPDTSKIDVNIKIERFDKELFAGKSKPIISTLSSLEKKYPFFYNDYFSFMVPGNGLSEVEIAKGLYEDKAYTDLQNETDSIFPTLRPYEEGLIASFKNIKYYYPNTVIPKFIGYVSGFAYQNTVGEDYLSIGLDMFLGAKSKFYYGIVQSVPMYISRKFTPEYLVPRTTETFVRENMFPEPEQYRNLLTKMMHHGKVLYFMDQILPKNTPDSIKIGYTDMQLRWSQEFEKDIWGYFLENEYLYNSEYQKIQVFLNDGPFTPGVGTNKESAPKLGVFIGWQIIKAYMKNNPQVTLQQLMADTDMQAILNKAKYKP